MVSVLVLTAKVVGCIRKRASYRRLTQLTLSKRVAARNGYPCWKGSSLTLARLMAINSIPMLFLRRELVRLSMLLQKVGSAVEKVDWIEPVSNTEFCRKSLKFQ